MTTENDDWPPEKRRMLAASFWTRGLLYVHEVGSERFWHRWRWVIGVLALVLALGTCAAIAWIIPIPVLRYVIAVVLLPVAYGTWQGIVGSAIMLLHGFARRRDSP